MPGNASAGNLSPLPDDLPPELRELAEFLRSHFYMIKTGVRTYALRNNWDPGTVSRYLRGTRIPEQSFVDILLADAGPQRSPAEVEQEQAEGFNLRQKALRLRNVRAAKSEQIAQDLAIAEQEINLLKAKERVLTKALVGAEAKHKSLYEKYQEMERSIQDGPRQLAISPALGQLAKERDGARKEIARLKEELALEKAARIAAEERRDKLQAALVETDAELVRAGGSAFAIGTYDSQRQLLVVMRGRRTRWGGVVGLIVVPTVTYGGPLYLGLIYHILTPAQGFLKIMTACGLFIPLWFALAVLKVEYPAADKRLTKILRLIVFTAAIFFIAALV